MQERLQKVGVQAEKVLTRMAHIGFSDIRKIFGPDGVLLPPEQWPEDVVPAIAGVETFEEYQGTGKNRVYVGRTRKIRLWDPNPSLTNLAKYLGLFPNERKAEEEGGEERPITNLELSAKIVYLVQLAIKKKREFEERQSQLNK
jgi:phage terminase small subunit